MTQNITKFKKTVASSIMEHKLVLKTVLITAQIHISYLTAISTWASVSQLSPQVPLQSFLICVACDILTISEWVIGHIHGTIVATTVGAIVTVTMACSVYTRRLLRRSSRQSLQRRSPQQLPRVYTTGDRRGDKHLFNRATNWRLSPWRSPVVYTWGDHRKLLQRSLWQAATMIAPCIRPIRVQHFSYPRRHQSFSDCSSI